MTVKVSRFCLERLSSANARLLSGPNAKPRTYTDNMKPLSMSSVDPKSRMTSGIPGANMELASGVRKVIADIKNTIPHFLPNRQFIGLEGSSGPSKSTMFGSCSVSSSGMPVLATDSGPGAFSTSFSIAETEVSFISSCVFGFVKGSVGAWCIYPRLLGMSASCPSAAARSMMSLFVGWVNALDCTSTLCEA
jgi:hypothetical protein